VERALRVGVVEEASLDRLDWLLAVAAKIADRAANEVRDVVSQPGGEHPPVGEAMGHLFEIRNEIYKEQPDLMPEFLKGKGRGASRGRTRPGGADGGRRRLAGPGDASVPVRR
jgi:hypothetical protein